MDTRIEAAARACEARGDHAGAVFCRLAGATAGAPSTSYTKSGGIARPAYSAVDLSTKGAQLAALDLARALIRDGDYDQADLIMAQVRAAQGYPRGATKAGAYDHAEQRARQLAATRNTVRWSGIKSVSDYSTAITTPSGSMARSVTLESRDGRLFMDGSPVARREHAGSDRYGFAQVRLTASNGSTAVVKESDV